MNRISVKYIIFLSLLIGCIGGDNLVIPKMSPGAVGGRLRILIENKSGQEMSDLLLFKFSLARGQAELNSIGSGYLSDYKIPINKDGTIINLPSGNYIGNISFLNSSDFSDRISLNIIFKEDLKTPCNMQFIDDGWFLNDELNCGYLKILPNKETVLKLTITDRYDSRFIGSLIIAVFTAGIITLPIEIRHVEAIVINSK
ncbi:hypothetical protein ACE5IS_02045 [Leptospira wolffii]|uniref:Lipoprotein n=1 Tax=Leptospira wolffii TaxID=409998 RepID=A0ABV5BK10_9LEPT|nr:hypothetical protein [Leptospira wolffii]